MNSQPFLSADTTTQTLSGRITHYNTEKKYGFIKTENNESFFFHFNFHIQKALKKSGIKDALRHPNLGDEVEFELRPANKDASKMAAFNIRHKGNFYRKELLGNAAENKILTGTLIKKEEEFFIKHPKAEILIPLNISQWEMELETNYDSHINKTVEFTLSPSKSCKNLKAFLTNRKFSEEYTQLLQLKDTEQTTTAVITGKIWQGLYAKILNEKVYAFALMPKDLNEEERNHFFRFNKGDQVKAKIKSIHKNKRVSITIEE